MLTIEEFIARKSMESAAIANNERGEAEILNLDVIDIAADLYPTEDGVLVGDICKVSLKGGVNIIGCVHFKVAVIKEGDVPESYAGGASGFVIPIPVAKGDSARDASRWFPVKVEDAIVRAAKRKGASFALVIGTTHVAVAEPVLIDSLDEGLLRIPIEQSNMIVSRALVDRPDLGPDDTVLPYSFIEACPPLLRIASGTV